MRRKPSAKTPPRATKVVRTDRGDGVRRVLACTVADCGRTTPYKGDDAAHDQSWGSWWAASPRTGELEQRWACPECWTPPRLIVEPIYAVPESFMEKALSKGDGKRSAAARLLSRPIEVDPARGMVWTREIVTRASGEGTRAFWERFGTKAGLDAQESDAKPAEKKARPSRRKAAA